MTSFGLRDMAAVVVGKAGVGEDPPLLSTLKAIPFQENHYHFGWVLLHGKLILHILRVAKICTSSDYNIVTDQ